MLNSKPTPGRAAWWVPICLAIVGTLVYLNTLSNPFVFDDTPWVIGNTRIQSLNNVGDMLTATNRPVLELTLALNYALGGEDPAGYHLFNLVIHVLAGLVLYGLVRRTLGLPSIGEAYRDNARWLAGAVALLWLLHPLNTQSVSYMIQRGESLMGLCYLFTLYSFVRFAIGDGARWGVAAVVACWVGVGAKEVMATAPLVVLLYDRTFIASSWREVFAKRWGIYLGLFAMWVPLAMLLTRGLGGEDASAGMALEGKMLSRWTYLLTQPQVIVEVYLSKALWPSPLVLDYAWVPAIPEDTPSGEVMRLFLSSVLWQGLLVVGLVGASVWGVIRHTWWGFVGACFFLVLAPTSSMMPIADIAVEHRMYLPLISVVTVVVFGFYALINWTLQERSARGKHGRVFAHVFLDGHGVLGRHLIRNKNLYFALNILAVALLLGVMTIARNSEYGSRISIWDSVVVARPHNGRAWHNLGKALEDEGRKEEAMACYQRVLGILPNYTPAQFNMGVILMDAGIIDDAIEAFQRVVRHDPDEAKAHEYLGLMYLFAKKDTDQAITSFHEAVRADPDLMSARQNLAAALKDSGRPGEAVTIMEDAIRRAKVMGLADEMVRDLTARRDRYRAQAGQAPDGP